VDDLKMLGDLKQAAALVREFRGQFELYLRLVRSLNEQLKEVPRVFSTFFALTQSQPNQLLDGTEKPVNTGVKVHQRIRAKIHQLESQWLGGLVSDQGEREGDWPPRCC
jgi:hypothetical protein